MKTLPIFYSLVLLTASAFGQRATEVDAPKLGAIGIRMIEFRARPDANQVVILRVEENHSEHGLEIYDTVTYRPKDELIGHLLLQDMGSIYPDQKKKWGITGSFGKGVREGFEFLNGKVGNDTAEFEFRAVEGGKDVSYNFRFCVIVMSYEEAKKLHPKLPEPAPGSWTYADMLKRQQPNPPNPHNKKPSLNETV